MDQETGKPRGFGFVTFDDTRDAQDAVSDARGKVSGFPTAIVQTRTFPYMHKPILLSFLCSRRRSMETFCGSMWLNTQEVACHMSDLTEGRVLPCVEGQSSLHIITILHCIHLALC